MVKKNSTDAIVASMKKKEFVIGLVTVAVAAVVIANLSGNKQTRSNQNTAVGNTKEQTVNPKGVTQTVTPAQRSKDSAQANQIKNIKQLANTSSENYVEVRSGDNYWKLAQRVCGNGRMYLSVQAENGGKALQPGDTVAVTCN
jgi:nucleoid-associated protein YgaU